MNNESNLKQAQMSEASEVGERPAQSFYRHHIFFCTNERAPNDERGDCKRKGGVQAFEYTKVKVHERKLSGKGGVRVNQTGCLNRCEHGPVCVVYPEAVWYQYVDQADLDEIVQEHLENGRVVTRLLIDGDEVPA